MIVLAFVTTTARAEIAIESYEGQRPPDADIVMAAFRSVLQSSGIDARPSEARNAILKPGLPAVVDRNFNYAKLTEQIEIGSKLFLTGEQKEVPAACQQLRSAVNAAHTNPGVLVLEEGARDLMTRAYALLGLCLARTGDAAGAADAMAEQIRSYPERPITRAVSGSEAEKLYTQTRATTDRAPRGKLLIKVTDPDARIFINEFGRGRGGSFSADFVPGKYRVLVQVGAHMKRYDVTIVPGQTIELSLDWRLEVALTISDAWVGFVVVGLDPDRQELELTRALAAKMNQGVLTIAGARMLDGRRTATLARYEGLVAMGKEPGTIGRLVRRGRVELVRGDEQAKLRALVAFVKSDAPSPDVTDLTRSEDRRAPPADSLADSVNTGNKSTSQGSKNLFPKLLVGAGAIAVVTGGVLLAIDEDLNPVGPQQETYRNSATGGVIIGSIGVVAVVVGSVLWLHGRGETSSNPTVSIGHNGTSLGWAGSF